jgi:hypothetical protein
MICQREPIVPIFFIWLQATQQSCRAALSFYLAWQVILFQVVGQFFIFYLASRQNFNFILP